MTADLALPNVRVLTTAPLPVGPMFVDASRAIVHLFDEKTGKRL